MSLAFGQPNLDYDDSDQPNWISYLRSPWLIALALALIAMACYWGIGRNDFVNYDDPDYVAANYNLDRGFSYTGIMWAVTTTTAHNWHPVTWFSHILDVSLFGRQPQWHHRVSVLLHAANAAVLFWVLMRLTKRVWPCALVAALFAVHPLNVESVAWAAERKNVLSTFFWFLTMWAYVRYVERPGLGRYAAVVGLFLLGLMSKPMLVTLPLVLLLLDYWPLRRIDLTPSPDEEYANRDLWATWKRPLLEKLPLLVLSLIFCRITLAVQAGAQSALSVVPFGQRLGNAIVAYVAYLWKLVWPFELAVLYPHPRGGLPIWQVLLSLLVLIAITACVLWFGRGRRYLPVGWFWYLGTLVPVIGLVQVGSHAMADRYTYVPMIGIFLIVAFGLDELTASWPRRVPVLSGVAAVVLVLLGGFTLWQVRTWRDTGTLFTRALEVNPNNDVAHFQVATHLLRNNQVRESLVHYREAFRLSPGDEEFARGLAFALSRDGQYDKALAILDQVLQRAPQAPVTLMQHGRVLTQKGDLTLAIADFQKILDLPDTKNDQRLQAEALFNLGVAYARQGRKDLALKHFEDSLALEPANSDAYLNVGIVHMELGDVPQAVQNFEQAIRYENRNLEARYKLAQAMLRQKKPQEAIRYLREAVAAQPNNPVAHFHLGRLLIDQRQARDGIVELDTAVRLKPDWDMAANALAWYLATSSNPGIKDGPRAVRLAEQVCNGTEARDPSYLDTLAAAYAAVGQYRRATETANQAHDAALRNNQTDLAAKIEQRRQLYASGQPYQETLD
jgi:tetratricopeptide (TPR) repeat protein